MCIYVNAGAEGARTFNRSISVIEPSRGTEEYNFLFLWGCMSKVVCIQSGQTAPK